ncbi:MAG: hypothetical protein RL757_2655 [Bacteroidota bacterium]|jgi:hypothetical protein
MFLQTALSFFLIKMFLKTPPPSIKWVFGQKKSACKTLQADF